MEAGSIVQFFLDPVEYFFQAPIPSLIWAPVGGLLSSGVVGVGGGSSWSELRVGEG